MEGFFSGVLENSSFPFFTALVLGLMASISPCTLATNITAIGFIGKDMENRKRVFYNGLVYTLGRAITYTLIALILFLGADRFRISGIFQQYGEKIIGPLLIIIGLVMLDVLKLRMPGLGRLTKGAENKGAKNYFDVLLLGMVFAAAFCPYSAVLYFGMLIPLSITSVSGLYLPIIFALATGIPVVVFAWFIAFSLAQVGGMYNKLKSFEIWFRRIVSAVFILVGIYYVVLAL